MFVSEKRDPQGSDIRQHALSRSSLLLGRLKTLSVTAAGFAVVAAASIVANLAMHPNAEGVFGACLAASMIWIAATDARRFRIPNRAVLSAVALGLLHAGIGEFGGVTNIALALARGAILACMFAALRSGYKLMRGREGLGYGDVKLAAVAGIWLDWDTAAIAIALSSLSGLAFYACHQYLTGRPLQAVSRVPFGLFFAPAIWLGWLFDSMWLSTL